MNEKQDVRFERTSCFCEKSVNGVRPLLKGAWPLSAKLSELFYNWSASATIAAEAAAAAEQKDDPDTAVIKATAIAASVMSPTAAAAKEKDDPDQISASTGGSIVITSTPTVCSS